MFQSHKSSVIRENGEAVRRLLIASVDFFRKSAASL